jgi:hypothetical protein
MSTKESSARTMQAIKATVHQELDEINFFHTNAAMVDVRVRGDDAGRAVSFSIGKAVFFLEGIGTPLQKCKQSETLHKQSPLLRTCSKPKLMRPKCTLLSNCC